MLIKFSAGLVIITCTTVSSFPSRFKTKPEIIIFVAMQFDSEAAKDIDKKDYSGVTLLKAEMNKDLQTQDLKKKQSTNESFWLMGSPDVDCKKQKDGKYIVTINGFDYYYGHCGSLDMPPYVWVDTGKITAEPKREEGVTRSQDQYGWYRKGPISDDFKIEQVLPHLFNKSFEYIKSHSSQTVKTKPFFMYLAYDTPHAALQLPTVAYPDGKGVKGGLKWLGQAGKKITTAEGT